MTTSTFYTSESGDDAAENGTNGGVSIATTFGIIGSSGGLKTMGVRYRATSELAGTTISSAVLWYRPAASHAQTGVVVRYSCEDTATPAAYAATSYNITGRTYRETTRDVTGTQLGTWASGTYKAVSGFEALIQDIATNYTPTDIAIKCTWVSGSAYRYAGHYDYYPTGTFKPYMVVTYASEPAPQSLPAPVVTAKATAPVPDLTPGEMPLEPDVITAKAVALQPTLAAGDYTMEPGVIAIKATAFAPTLTPGSRTLAAPVAIAKATAPLPTLTGSGAAPQSFIVPVATAKAVAIAPTLTPGSVTMTAPVVVAKAKAITKAGMLTGGTYTMSPAVISVKAITRTPQLLPSSVTLSPPAVIARAIPSLPLLTTAGVDTYVQYGLEYPIDIPLYPAGTQFYVQAWLRTDDEGYPVYAFLYNKTLGQEVTDSRISSTHVNTVSPPYPPSTELKLSSALTLTTGTYAVRFGGATGCNYYCTAVLRVVS